jgi:hypothetical protein
MNIGLFDLLVEKYKFNAVECRLPKCSFES